ncbi:MAG: transcription elongation factor GreA, partial [Rickettsiales bacterium]|nr:transcription elongation factor GreA [Rickettsiales bacterium]
MDRIPMTCKGAEKLEAELYDLKYNQRPAIISAIQDARALGDLSENAEYHSAKERQGFIESRISYLEGRIAAIDRIDPIKVSCAEVKFSASVRIVECDTDEEKTYQIVGDDEADPSSGMVSYKSPIARALMGKQAGDTAEFS